MTILCPTRGGEASYPNQDCAIAIAKERGVDLVFLYVSDVHFFDKFASAALADFESTLDELGEFLLVMAQERAKKAGLPARTTVRHGSFSEAVKKAIATQKATTLILGAPGEETAITTRDYLRGFIQDLQTETGVEVLVVHLGEKIAHYERKAE